MPHDRMQGGEGGSALGFCEGKALYPPALTPRSTTTLREGICEGKIYTNGRREAAPPRPPQPPPPKMAAGGHPHYRLCVWQAKRASGPSPALKYRPPLPRDPCAAAYWSIRHT